MKDSTLIYFPLIGRLVAWHKLDACRLHKFLLACL